MTPLVHAAAALASPDFLVASLGPALGFTAGPVAGRAIRGVRLVGTRRALGIATLGLLCLLLGAAALFAGLPLLALNPVASVGFGAGQVFGLAGGVGLSVGTSLCRAMSRAGRCSVPVLVVRAERA